MNYSKTLEQLLSPMSLDDKFKLFYDFYNRFKDGSIAVAPASNPVVFSQPSYANICHVVPLGKVKRIKDLQTTEGKISLLHALMHIEYSAIDLALDASYRFSSLPHSFYSDWLEVADEEILHFNMLRALINELGSDYGDFEVHNGLFLASMDTLDLMSRMAVIPRSMEANGLDANLQMKNKILQLASDPMLEKILNALAVIEKDEISHVQKGDRWFKYACKEQNLDPMATYFDILKSRGEGTIKRKMHIEARKMAGFSCSELNHLANEHLCD